MKFVGPRASGKGDDATASPPELSRKVACFHLKFLDRVLRHGDVSEVPRHIRVLDRRSVDLNLKGEGLSSVHTGGKGPSRGVIAISTAALSSCDPWD